jgi:hypothetical protein
MATVVFLAGGSERNLIFLALEHAIGQSICWRHQALVLVPPQPLQLPARAYVEANDGS